MVRFPPFGRRHHSFYFSKTFNMFFPSTIIILFTNEVCFDANTPFKTWLVASSSAIPFFSILTIKFSACFFFLWILVCSGCEKLPSANQLTMHNNMILSIPLSSHCNSQNLSLNSQNLSLKVMYSYVFFIYWVVLKIPTVFQLNLVESYNCVWHIIKD